MKTDLGYIRGAQGEAGPQGETGPQGPAGTVKVGSVTSASYGTAPKVTNSGTSTAAVLDFVIPQGPPGETVADVSELTANFITESAESYPTYTTTEKMKVILGKIKKYLADLKSNAASLASKIAAAEKNITNIQTDVGGINTALTGKLDKTDVIANLTATTSGKALDATQGKALQDQITQLNSDLSDLIQKDTITVTLTQGSNNIITVQRTMGVWIPFLIIDGEYGTFNGIANFWNGNDGGKIAIYSNAGINNRNVTIFYIKANQ